ncbi:MAG: hypothetical protein L3J58_06580 [Emcibacter sp.]|nr:hypothetical protein [Emcibacter sp.]
MNSARAEVKILDVRTGLHPDKTRIVLELSEVAFYQISYLNSSAPGNFKEVIIDLRETPGKAEVASLVKKAEVIGLLEKISVEDYEGGVRLRIFLRKAATVDRSFMLKPEQDIQYRLVFDLKAVTAAEWARQVKLTAPQEKVPQPEPVTIISPAPAVAPIVAAQPEEIPPAEPRQEQEPPETYDDMMTGESNFTLSGYIEVEGRGFTQSSFSSEPKDWTVSFALEPLLEYVSDSGDSQVMFRPFGRFDVNDKGRSHFDIRELNWTGTADRWQVTVGIDTVFWGVTESSHLVDIINQNDNLEDIDQEDKLGQPMISASYDSRFGVFSTYVMTYFREMRFPGANGRLRLPLLVDYTQTQYESASGKWRPDFAVRWTHVIGNVDVGLYHFKGTSREPELILGADVNNNAILIPRYNLIDQTGLDIQGTFDDILIKFEAIRRAGNLSGQNSEIRQDYWAMTGGIEYSFYGIGGGDSDIGLLAEYLYDDRGSQATTAFEDDLFIGMRWAANDIDSTQLLVGAIFDLDSSAKFINVEGSRRIGDDWKITLDARFFMGVPVMDPIYPLSRDDFFQIRLARYF